MTDIYNGPGDGDCFEVAARAVLNEPGLVLVHGLVLHPELKVWHWHAWVEETKTYELPGWPHPITVVTCIDRSNGHNAELPQVLFYKLGGIEEVTRYTSTEAAKQMMGSGHFGPWIEGDGSDER
jgi:hypothetical protein